MLREIFEPQSIELVEKYGKYSWRHPWFGDRIQDCRFSGLEFSIETFHETFNQLFEIDGYQLKYEQHNTDDCPTQKDSQRAIDSTILGPNQYIVEVEPQPDHLRQYTVWIWILTCSNSRGRTLSSFSLDDIVENS